MKIDTAENLTAGAYNRELCRDLIVMLMYGAASLNVSTKAILYKCTSFEYLGNDSKIEDFVRKNYIRVSSIIRGKTATDLGNVAQQYVVTYLANALGGNDWMFKHIDLFAGLGGIRFGVVRALEKMGIQSECVLSSEIDEKACETYELNFNENPQGGVKQITGMGPFDLMLAYHPKAFLLENVRGLCTHDHGRTFETIMKNYISWDMAQKN